MNDALECLCCQEVAEFVDELKSYQPEPEQEFTDTDYAWPPQPEKGVQCYALHPAFQANCLSVYALRTAYYQYRKKYHKKDKDATQNE